LTPLDHIDLTDEPNWSNLQFLLNVCEKTLFDWSEKMDAEDIEYGILLMKNYIQEINHRIDIIATERKMKECYRQDFYPHSKIFIDKITRGMTK